MKNMIDICKDFGIEIPADKHAEFNKAVAENYKTIAEFEKKVNRLTDDLATEKSRADAAEDALKGFDGIDPANIKAQIEEANKKVKEAQEAAEKQLAERDFNDALSKALDGIEFTSSAARKAIEADVRANCSKLKDGTIIGFSDVIAAAKKADASAFVDESVQQLEANKPKFTAPNSITTGGKLTRDDIMNISDRAERRAAMAKNQHLFT